MTRNLRVLLCALTAATVLPASADLLYDNSSVDIRVRFNPGTTEVGDQIVLAAPGFLTNWSFEYYGLHNNDTVEPFAGNIQATVTFYRMDGPLVSGEVSPGTVFWTSNPFSVSAPTTRNTFVFSGSEANFNLPQEFTWSVQFSGMGTGDEVGLDIYTPGTVGLNYPDYWRRNTDGTWSLAQSPSEGPLANTPINFASRFEGTIPEPSTAALLLLGTVSAFVVARRKRG